MAITRPQGPPGSGVPLGRMGLAARLATLALVLAWPFALFGPAVLAGALLAPGDGLGYYLPVRAIAALGWLAGEPPFWNPFHFGGMPLLAAIQAGSFFPGNLPFLFLAPGPAMNATVLGAYVTAGVGAWAYAVALGLPGVAAGLAGLAFMGTGYMVAHLEHLTMLQAAGLMPWLFLAVELAGVTGQRRWALALAPLLALQLFAGYPQTTMITGLLLAPYALARVWGNGLRPGLATLGWLAGAAVLGVGLAAVQLLPTADLLAASPRGQVPYAELIDHSWPLRELPTLLFPFMYGGGLSAVAPWGAGPWRNELVGYAGLGTLVLALVGLRAAFSRLPAAAPRGPALYWALVAPIAGLLALGGQTPFYKLWAMVPGLKLARVPGRHLLELDFALAMLAALGLAWLLQARDARDRAWAAGLALAFVALPMAVVLVGLGLGRGWLAARWQAYAPTGLDVAAALAPVGAAFWGPVGLLVVTGAALALTVRRPAGAWALLAVLAVDLGLFGWHAGWRALLPPDAAVYQRPVLSDGPRTLAVADYPFLDPQRTGALRYPQTGALLGAKLVNGYEPIMPTAYARLAGKLAMGGGVGDPEVLGLDHHALDVLGTRWVRFGTEKYALAPWSRAIADHPRWDRLPDEGGVVVYTNHRALPRAWRPTRVLGRKAAAIALTLRDDPAFDPRRTALIEGDVARLPAWTPGAAWARTVAPNRLRVRTTGTGPGLVVISEAWQPGWTAQLGARALPVIKVDGLVLGVEVPAGDQVVELAYAPPGWPRALGISAAAAGLWVLAVVGAFLAARRRRRPTRPGALHDGSCLPDLRR